MRRRQADERFEIIEPAVRRQVTPRKCVSPVDGPALVPVRVIASTAPVARQVGLEQTGSVDVILVDGTRLRFPAGVSATFVAEIIVALRSGPC